ncbi:hypothetical protein Acy02nite_15340 [Actinoplanes cyaneus]|uniref:Uncharacterized protein n=1 Tax=Actinoplanes cyaneus TaxID=52696 RepID=A0A919M3Y5_9ACTN|nr:hypothetical protein Acy02nite_15340 [Actinoplanes cyaneus]
MDGPPAIGATTTGVNSSRMRPNLPLPRPPDRTSAASHLPTCRNANGERPRPDVEPGGAFDVRRRADRAIT